jgi:hypothetical protein
MLIINLRMGKYSKRRFCPALDREITAADCGENRISRHPCPADCEFNPFSPANYDTFQQLEAEVIRKGYDWHMASAPDRSEAEWELDQAADLSAVEQHALQMELMFGRRDADGRNLAERWEAAGFPGLKNDERVIQRAMAETRVGLLEVHRVIDDHRLECMDLLNEAAAPILLCDKVLAAKTSRFTTILGFHYALPHFWRTKGFGLQINSLGGLGPREVAVEVVRHLGGPENPAEWSPWLIDNYTRFSNALDATRLAHYQHAMARLDAQLGKAVYELRVPFAACRDRLDGLPEVHPDEVYENEENEGFVKAWAWSEGPAKAVVSGEAEPMFGRLVLGQSHLRIEAVGEVRLRRFRDALEGALGDSIRFCGERRDDLSKDLKTGQDLSDHTLVPPRLLESLTSVSLQTARVPVPDAPGAKEASLARFKSQQAKAWLDLPVPGLDDKTPREAAADPAIRPRLLQMLKDRVRQQDEENLRTGSTGDLNWMLRELGADELIFDPPPWRPPPEDPDEEDWDEEGAFEEPEEERPPLPDRPFTQDEVTEQLERIVGTYARAGDARMAMEAAGCFPLEDLQEALTGVVSRRDFAFLVPVLIQAWHVFVPVGCFGPEVEVEDVEAMLHEQVELLESKSGPSAEAEERVAKWLVAEGAQPELLGMLSGLLLRQYEEFSPKKGSKQKPITLLILVLRAFIEVLDQACREDW